MTPLDQFAKQEIKARFYLRYTDDFIFISDDKEKLQGWLKEVRDFLRENLKLDLHPKKISFHNYSQGVDFLGYIEFPYHRLVRTRTKQRMFKKLRKGVPEAALVSYLRAWSNEILHKVLTRKCQISIEFPYLLHGAI